MRQTSEVNSNPASEFPISVVLLDQSLRRLNDISGEWKPAKIRDDCMATGFGNAGKLQCGFLAIEPMPTLARRNNICDAVRQRNGFRRPDLVFNRYGGGDVEFPGLIEKPAVGVNSDDLVAPKSESAGEGSRASSNVNDSFPRNADSERAKSSAAAPKFVAICFFIVPSELHPHCLLALCVAAGLVRTLLSIVYSNHGMNISSQLCSLQKTSLSGAGL